MRRVLIVSVVLVSLSVWPGARCGGDDNSPKLPAVEDPFPGDNTFHVNGEADRYAGPAPLKVQFASRAFGATGDIDWSWTFEDGTTSTEKNPEHTFREPGYYLVYLEGKDTKKGPSARGLYLGIWPAKVWAAAQRGEVDQALEAHKQRVRTAKRKRRLRESCRRDPACRRVLERQKAALKHQPRQNGRDITLNEDSPPARK